MEVKTRRIFTSKADWIDYTWRAVCAGAFVFALLLIFVPDAFSAPTTTPCDGRHYVWALSLSGSPPWVVQSFSDSSIDVDYALAHYVSAVFPGTYTVGACSSNPVITGSTCPLISVSAGVIGNAVVTRVCAPVESGVVADYAIQDILVLCASVLLFGVGWISGQQR